MVYLLGQMGNSKEALSLIISRLGDVKRVNIINNCYNSQIIYIISDNNLISFINNYIGY